MMQNFYKNWLQISKVKWGIWITSGKYWTSKKLKFNQLHLSKNYIPSAKTYTEDSSNITFNYLCENSPNSLCHFWNHKLFFTTQLVYIISTQKLHTFDKISHQSANFEIFHCSSWNSSHFSRYFSNKVIFSLNFGWLFSVMRDYYSVDF